MLITLLAADGLEIRGSGWRWVAIFVVERVVTVWAAGGAAAVALPLVIELGYDLVLQAVFVHPLRHRHRAGGRLEPRPHRAVPRR